MGIRSEQLNIESLLKFFIGRNEFKRKYIIDMLSNLTNDETDALGLIGYEDLYNFKQNLYLTIKNEIIDGSIKNLFNNVDKINYVKDSYYFESFLRTYPLKRILDLRNIKYKNYESEDSLYEKIQQSNPTEYSVVVGTITEDSFESIRELQPDYFYSSKDTILRIAIKELLRDRDVKYDPNATLEDLIEIVIGTNPIVTEFNYANDYYLEPDALYTEDYLSKYGFLYLLYLRNYSDYYDEEPINELNHYVEETNPNINYVSALNELPLKYNGYYDSDFLEKYGYLMVLKNRGIVCSPTMPLDQLKQLVREGNPTPNDAYSNSILAVNRAQLILRAYINNFVKNKTIEVDSKLFFKQGYANFVGQELSVEIEHNTELAPIAALIQPLEQPNADLSAFWCEMDSKLLKVYCTGKNTSAFKWTLFFDNRNYIQYIKNSEYNETYFRETFGSIFLKKIKNDAVSIVHDDEHNKDLYCVNLAEYTTAISLNEVLFINGVSYPLSSENSISFDAIERKVYFLDLVINPTDEIVLTCIAQDYYEDKDFENSVYVNENSSFGEENFAGNYNCVEFKHYLKTPPNFVIITPIEYDTVNDKPVGNISWEVSEDTIKVYNTGLSTTKFRWFAFYNEYVESVDRCFDDTESYDLPETNLFVNVNVPSNDNELPEAGTIIFNENEFTNELTISETNKTHRDYTLLLMNPPKRSVTKKTKFLEYTNSFETNEDGKFDNSPFTKPNGSSSLNYSGKLSATKLQAYNGSAITQYVPVFQPEDFENGDVLSYDSATKSYIKTNQLNVGSVVGVVCNDGSVSINSYLTKTVPIALLGIVDVKVRGKIKAGDFLSISSTEGVATSYSEITFGTIIGKALENYDSTEIGMIKIIVSIM